MITQSWDTAIKSSAHHDASACATFLNQDGKHFLLDMQCIRLDYPQLKRFICSHAARYQPEALLIEDKPSVQSLLQDLRVEQANLPLIAVMPKGDKLMRLPRVSSMFAAGNVAFPHKSAWLDSFERELQAFPHPKYYY